MVVTEGDPANPTTLLTRQQHGAAITSSYDEEKAVLRMALEWLSPSHAAAVICTDSQSFRKAIQSGSADTAGLRCMLNKRAGKTTLLWIPGHHGIAGNEEADAYANQAAAIADGAPRPVSFAAASALVCRTLTDPTPCHCRTEEVYTKTFFTAGQLSVVSTRRDAVLLTRLRAGHTPLFKAYGNQLDTTVDPKCPSCGEEPQTVERWLQRCPNAVAVRQQLFGEPPPSLSVLTTNPGSVLALARKTLLQGPYVTYLNNNNIIAHFRPFVCDERKTACSQTRSGFYRDAANIVRCLRHTSGSKY